MNARDFEKAKQTVRRERDIPYGMFPELTQAQLDELNGILRTEVGLIHREAPSARLIYERPPK